MEKKKINEAVVKTEQERRTLEATGNHQLLNLERSGLKVEKLDYKITQLKEELVVA